MTYLILYMVLSLLTAVDVGVFIYGHSPIIGASSVYCFLICIWAAFRWKDR